MKISIRYRNGSPDEALTEHVKKRALLALGRFTQRLDGVLVRLEDMNGPKGGIDKRCTIELTGVFGQRLVEVRDQNFTAAVDGAFAVAQRSITRLLKRSIHELDDVQ